ncbi:LegC family aminotransferase [Campylobacter sp.]|uniref:LegC family aminotransferase n=1 Tax=Campylobacter sp. TaxID=205 RepID=UPI0026DD0E11|nr:LegC family aminotransferase [Campylobacter sp.]MDO4674414.1 LegC family aminotransferase [Campylobacter sp.]
MFEKEIAFIKSLYPKREKIPLHEPFFDAREEELVSACLRSGFVSSAGEFVERLEEELARFTGARYAVATSSGTAALHTALLACGVGAQDAVITQALSFVATANAIAYTGAEPIFLDSSLENLSLSAAAVGEFLEKHSFLKEGKSFEKAGGRRIKALIVMHTFGLAGEVRALKKLCKKHGIILIEDAAQALGSLFKNKNLGTFGKVGILSFNGNKIITAGLGGALLTNDKSIAAKARHLSTTAKIPHPYRFSHDRVGYNYRLANLNAALLLAQLEKMPRLLEDKRATARLYESFFEGGECCEFVREKAEERSNFWLCALKFKRAKWRERFIEECWSEGILVRPIYKSLATLRPYRHCQKDALKNTKILEKSLVNLPSSPRLAR